MPSFQVPDPKFKELTQDGEDGYLLLGAVVAIALVMIALSVVAVKVSFALRREREVESVHRANQYVRAIREYYLKFGRYPGSVDQLVNTNNTRFLRQKYVDPLTGKPDYRLIIVGQNKTQPMGFFGKPLGGLPGAGPGAGAGNTSNAGAANSAGLTQNGSANTGMMGFGGGNTASGPQSNGPGAVGAQTAGTQGPGTQGPGTQNGSSSTTGVGISGSGGPASGAPGTNLGPIMGVGSSAKGSSIIAVNDQTSYDTWEFLYDPRVERLRQAGQLNSGVNSASGNNNPAGLGGSPQTGAGAPGAGATNSGPTSAQPPNGAPSNSAQPTQP